MIDYCVIGGGIVGLATAMQLLERSPGATLVLIEKEPALAQHQSGRNSGVIHSGIYYAPGSLKARLCAEGATRTEDFCSAHNVPFDRCGKLIVATDHLELARLLKLQECAAANGIVCDWVGADELRAREPNISGVAALFVPSTGIVDYPAMCDAMAARIKAAGGEIMLGKAVDALSEGASSVTIRAGDEQWRARQLVVCAGLQADRMARLGGIETDFRIIAFRGEYYRLRPELSEIAQTLIYPVPDAALPFLGVHLTRMIDGGMTVGPNAVLGLSREGYRKGAIDMRDIGSMAAFPGFWHMMKENLRPGLNELRNTLSKRAYLSALRKYCPSLELADLLPEPAGIRAQAVMRDGSFVHDFLIRETARSVHVCNAPSPAATSSLPIGAAIVERVLAQQGRLA